MSCNHRGILIAPKSPYEEPACHPKVSGGYHGAVAGLAASEEQIAYLTIAIRSILSDPLEGS